MSRIHRLSCTPLSALSCGSPDAPPVVLLHGVFDSADCWFPVMEELAHFGYRPIAIDLPGHGQSPRTGGALSVQAMASAVHETLLDLNLKSAVVVGHSMGGLVAHEIALTLPDSVDSLILEDPAWSLHTDPHTAPPFLAERAHQLRTWPPAQILSEGRTKHPSWDERDISGWLTAKIEVDPDLLIGSQDWHGHTGPGKWTGYNGHVLLITAGAMSASPPVLNDAIVTDSMVGDARASLGSRLRHVSIDNVGHNIRKDAVDDYIRAILPALSEATTQ